MNPRSSIIRLAAALPQGSEERRALLKMAGGVPIGRISAYPGMDMTYGERMDILLNPNNFSVEIVVKSWAREGGMDTFGGAGPAEEVERSTVPSSNLKSLVSEIKKIRSRHMLLRDAPLKDFKWTTQWSTRRIEGLNAVILQKVIDSYTMDRDVWEREWNKPAVKPTGGPFSFGPGTKAQDVVSAISAQGFPAKIVRSWERELISLDNGRMLKSLIKLLIASAMSYKKYLNSDGWDTYEFKFEGVTLFVERTHFPRGGYNWALVVR